MDFSWKYLSEKTIRYSQITLFYRFPSLHRGVAMVKRYLLDEKDTELSCDTCANGKA